MKNLDQWGNPNEFTLAIRCTETKFASGFINKGEIKFSTPSSWVKYAEDCCEGRGDRLEGSLAVCNIFDVEGIAYLYSKYSKYNDLFSVVINDFFYLKRRKDMELPCFCFYMLKTEMFPCPCKEGIHHLETVIQGDYFRDFNANMEPAEVEKLKDADKPAVLVINDFQEFRNRVTDFLLDNGVRKDEIIFIGITYLDFLQIVDNGMCDFMRDSPMQLAVKDARFRNQKEGRIIINTNRKEVIEMLSKPICIGDLSDICQMSETYFHEGASIQMDAEIEKY